MTQEEIARHLRRARVGRVVRASYESPRGLRRYEGKVTAIKESDTGQLTRVQFPRGSASWMFIQKGKLETGESVWCFYQPNPYPILDVEVA
jgi:hypothetical protein